MERETFLYHCRILLAQTAMKYNPQAILFDMDGVLIDSLDSWWKALNDALTVCHHKGLTRDEFVSTYWGHDLKDNLQRLHLNPSVATLCNVTYGHHIEDIRLYPDTTRTLQQLTSYKKAIITNTPTDCARQILQRFDIARYFQAIVTSDDVVKAKPDPEIVFTACAQLHVNPTDVVLVGDTDSDVRAGQAAGCRVVGLRIPADVTIQQLSELLVLLI
ncbi:MAG: HAD family hydrolase [Candidatus Thermoplasmatota archaeon]|nr:HAD family hydrolase [Candidatus Thermoplasmatota archaeon]